MKFMAKVWKTILYVMIILLVTQFFLPFRILITANYAIVTVVLITLIIAILDKKRLGLILPGIAVAILMCISMFDLLFYDPIEINNPFSSQQFVALYMPDGNNPGHITYYRRVGPFLFDEKEKDPFGYILDDPFVAIDRNSIYVDSFLMKGGMSYDIHNDRIDLRREKISEWHISDGVKTFVLGKDRLLVYCDNISGSEKKMMLPYVQYNALVESFARLPLADSSGSCMELRIELEDVKKENALYMAYVEGEEVWELLCTICE